MFILEKTAFYSSITPLSCSCVFQLPPRKTGTPLIRDARVVASLCVTQLGQSGGHGEFDCEFKRRSNSGKTAIVRLHHQEHGRGSKHRWNAGNRRVAQTQQRRHQGPAVDQ